LKTPKGKRVKEKTPAEDWFSSLGFSTGSLGVTIGGTMFWRKKPAASNLVALRAELNHMTSTVLEASAIDFDASSQLNQALVGTFMFGMIYAHGSMHNLTSPEVHALAISVFRDTLHYTDEAAAEGVHACIDASHPGVHDTMNAILHRGIDGHAAYVKNDVAAAAANLRSILAQFEA
jgi:hypothetical protein